LGRECFALLGYSIKDELGIDDFREVKKEIDDILRVKPIAEFLDMPPMTDPLHILLIEAGWLMTVLVFPFYI